MGRFHIHLSLNCCRKQYLVDNVNDTIRLNHISNRYHRDLARFIFNGNLISVIADFQDTSAYSLDHVRAAVCIDHLFDSIRHSTRSHHVACENLCELSIVFWHEQALNGSLWQGSKGFVGWREDGERAISRECVDQSSSLNSRDKGGVICGLGSVLNDICVSYIGEPPTIGLADAKLIPAIAMKVVAVRVFRINFI